MADSISRLQAIPELQSLNKRSSLVRIPDQIDVPLTPRVTRLIDSAGFRRLRGISQLGLVSLVYPGATHNRFEHSLGVFRNALLFVNQLSQFPAFSDAVTERQVTTLIVASLLHDIGHWPFCHPIEDMNLDVPDHESVAASYISEGEIAELLRTDWDVEPQDVLNMIAKNSKTPTERLLSSILTGPIDIDKMDYLYRDSLHCGVPYGMNFDAPRLIKSITINRDKDGIALSSKAKTAAEMMVFARYVMFSEVYWHHAVRSATAMLQRVFFTWHEHNSEQVTSDFLSQLDDRKFVSEISTTPCKALFEDLFDRSRNLYKRLLDYNAEQNPDIFYRLAHQPYQRLMQIGEELIGRINLVKGLQIGPHELLIDAPPPGLEVQFKVEVTDDQVCDSLEEISPVVKALAQKQFDHVVKRVRVYVHPRLRETLPREEVEEILLEISNQNA